MKHFITFLLAITIAFAASAQKDITKFMGIPVDGSKTEMIQKLKAKGFVYDAQYDFLTGEFNGRDVTIHVATNNNKVYRIMVIDANGTSEGDIKRRFNRLCEQFDNNDKYFSVGDFTIGEDVDISYEMLVKNKRFEAAYLQYSKADLDTTSVSDWMASKILENYNIEEWQSLSEEESSDNLFNYYLEFILNSRASKSPNRHGRGRFPYTEQEFRFL